MFEVNHEIVFVQLAEIDLGAVTFRVVEATACVRRESAEQFGGRQNDKVRSRKTKPARERAEKKIDIMQCVGADQFAKTLDLALGLKINDDARFIFLPFVQALNELVALRFREQKIADREFADIAILKRTAEVLGSAFNPAFTDWNLRFRFFFGLDLDDEIVIGDVIPNEAALVIGCAEKDVDLAQVAHGSLSIDVELAERFDVIAEELQSNRQRRLP